MRLRLLLGPMFGLLMLAPGGAQAQTACPPGMEPYAAGVCGYSRSEPEQQGPAQAPPRDPRLWGDPNAPKFAPGWTALGLDQGKSVAVSVQGKKSRKEAIEAALAGCQGKGGTNCTVLGVIKVR